MLLTEKYNDVERYALSQVWMMKDGTAAYHRHRPYLETSFF